MAERLRPYRYFLGALLIFVLMAVGSVMPAYALDVTVRVTIERVRALDNFGTDTFPEAADFYAVVTINGEEFDNLPGNDPWEDDDDISPNWEFSKPIDISAGTIPLTIVIFDEDGGLRFDDDQADLDPGSGRGLELTVTLAPCGVTGDVTGGCGTSLSSGGAEDDSAEVTFRLDVVEPPSAPGLNVRCIHSPIWPQVNEAITITASSLSGTLGPRVADSIEIWVNSQTGPATVGGGTTRTYGPVIFLDQSSLAYGCRVIDDGVPVFSGWRVVNIGNPPAGRAVPVLFTGPLSSRIDILFIADRDNYTSASDPSFLQDVRSVIRDAYYQGGTSFSNNQAFFLRNQDKFNFWIALDRGDAEDDCDHDPPDMDNYRSADVGAILHTDNFRDCALLGERIFSSEPTSIFTVLHETGHTPFGLADEYCCDGGYFQADPFPNVYEGAVDCTNDAPNLGRTGGNCREFDEDGFWFFDTQWWISEPVGDDLMEDSSNHTPRAADMRRILWIFDRCAEATC